MASISGWYEAMSTQDLRDEAIRAEKEAQQFEKERQRQNAENEERARLIERIEAAKRTMVSSAL